MTNETVAMLWVAGSNMPGYLPNMEPEAFETFDEARNEILFHLDCELDALWPADDAREIKEIERAACYIRDMDEGEFSAQIGRYVYWISKQ